MTQPDKLMARHQLNVTDKIQVLHIPRDSAIVGFSESRGYVNKIDVWVEQPVSYTGSSVQHDEHFFLIHSTGFVIPGDQLYLGTVFTSAGAVQHIYKVA